MKHIDIRYHYVREMVEERQVELYFVEGSHNPADLFIKNLGQAKFDYFRKQLGLEFIRHWLEHCLAKITFA